MNPSKYSTLHFVINVIESRKNKQTNERISSPMLQLVPEYPAAQTHLLLTQVPPLRQSGLQVAIKYKV